MNYVFTTRPYTIDELKSVANDFARDMDSAMISKAESMQIKSIRVKFARFHKMKSAHFEHLSKHFPNIILCVFYYQII